MASNKEILRVVKDLKNTVTELNKNYREQGLPVTDGSRELQQFCAQLEFLLQYDLKEKRNLFGQRKDYWDFLSRILTRLHSGVHAGVQHVTSLDKLKTAMGKGRAFIRYCLVHRQLAETLQLCFMEPEVISEWYYARSPFLDRKLWTDILGFLYELDGIAFHLALRRVDLDAAWPVVSEALPRCSNPAAMHSQQKAASSEVGNPNRNCANHQGATKVHESSPRTASDQHAVEPIADDRLSAGLENSMEKWVGIWRSRKNSLLQIGALLKLSHFMEVDPTADREVQKGNGELQAQVEKLSKEQPGSISSTKERCSLLHQADHCLCGKMESPPTEGDTRWKQDFKTLMWELAALRQKLAQQQEENASLRLTLLEENQLLKEEQAKHEQQHKEKMDEQEKQQQELAKAIKALREAEDKVANLTGECQEAWSKRDAAERSLEEAEQRLSSQEAERRKHLADIEAQELRRQHLASRCQSLQEKLKACEESLEKWEAQGMKSQGGQLGMNEEQSEGMSCRPAEREEHPAMLEWGPLRGKLERSLAEIQVLEREKETLMETLVSQEKSLVFSKLEVQDLQKELSACQEHVATLRTSLEEQGKALRVKEEAAQGLQRELNDQLAQLRDALEKNTMLEARLEEAASKKSQLEAQAVEEQARCESTLQELGNQLGAFEKELATLQEERQQLRATLQQALKEREALATQAESMASALDGRTQEATQLRKELEELKATSKAQQTSLQETNEVVASALRGECLQLRNQLEQLEQEKMQATNMAEQLSEDLEQGWEWPREEGALERTWLPSVPVLDSTCGARDEKGRDLVRKRGITEENSHGGAGSPPMNTELLQVDVLQDAASPVKKGAGAKPCAEAHGKCLTYHLKKMTADVQQAKQMFVAKEQRMMHLMEQLSRSQQEKEQLLLLLEKSQQESEEKEKRYKGELSEQGEIICNMKGKLLELLREKDALWQKTEGIASTTVSPAPQNPGVCVQCKKDFRLMSRRYQCRLCRSIVCHACSVSSGHKERSCLPCYQKRNGQGT
ncbi:RUN and FYVE domain-containing protein 4 isoform X1 [Zootoca vivipara]|uniref:RUN and FYVE domain-containing protein 4 isoform X1 n=1 Tax=Zootoca vivipara TaxID=8524 RepID=UPI00293C0DDA|nr:RUN and FYVE domain-containing protein 4 isoform X1 [Zootoca vivipara]XP_034983851.2 RUN and FYVE domain-containing protein 4 isoform X1 [Zootoca vivipara]XP_034983859.2 RUN and FYVE domain-containing protein 4 isoform X1 [Zootoca vivipara]